MSQTILPDGWARPRGYSNAIMAEGRQIFLGGMIGWNPLVDRFETDDFAGQLRQTLANIVAVLRAAGAGPEHLVRTTWYVTDKHEYLARLKEIGAAWRDVIGRHYPAMAVVQVTALVEERAKVEIEATAVVPPG
ncbi:MAG: RidA family protein [Alphaproteobacteria bacterium]|nr:RidA family protein [Alphaproteobacteria bacterium]